MGLMPNQDDAMYLTIGFLTSLFIMKTIRALRPASAHDMSVKSSGCSSCRGK